MPLPANTNLLFDLEAQRARLEIRDFFLQNLFREVYENIGQVLSLVRVMLARQCGPVEPASELVGQSIRELREMCRDFYPDAEILKENGFAEGIRAIIKIIFPGTPLIIDTVEEIQPERKWIVFNIILELLNRIKETNGELTGVKIHFTQRHIDLIITYKGVAIPLEAFQQRAELINGKFELLNDPEGLTHLKLLTPLN